MPLNAGSPPASLAVPGGRIIDNHRIFILKDDGELTLVKASLQGYEKIGRHKVLQGHDAWGPMALVNGRLLLRDAKRMICLDVAAK